VLSYILSLLPLIPFLVYQALSWSPQGRKEKEDPKTHEDKNWRQIKRTGYVMEGFKKDGLG
jgi:hypothetical protein